MHTLYPLQAHNLMTLLWGNAHAEEIANQVFSHTIREGKERADVLVSELFYLTTKPLFLAILEVLCDVLPTVETQL